MQPKVFISYSWSTPAHQSRVREWAEQLIADGIDVVLDIYDLKEGHDKFAFMERMITDDSVTQVLVISDKAYAEKADARKAGVGTESQIISKEVYEKVDQSKFIPIACEFDSDGNPFMPIFLRSRIWIDFSSPEAVNENWEKLIRLIFGKPLHEKPKLGKPPVYITDDTASPSSPVITKFNAFRHALLHNKQGLPLYRKEFLSSCVSYADALRTRQRPDIPSLGKRIIEDCTRLKVVRNHIADWILLEGATSQTDEFGPVLLGFLEELRELKARPPELNAWNDSWFDAHSIFVYETFLYVIAALIKTASYDLLHEIYTSHYLRPVVDRYGDNPFEDFTCFYGNSETIQSELMADDRRYHSPAAELIKRQADREDIPFTNLIEAELLTLLMTFITPNARWYPGTVHYAPYNHSFPLFLRATQHKHFQKLATITGIVTADDLRNAVKSGQERLAIVRWTSFSFSASFWSYLNMDKLDSLK